VTSVISLIGIILAYVFRPSTKPPTEKPKQFTFEKVRHDSKKRGDLDKMKPRRVEYCSYCGYKPDSKAMFCTMCGKILEEI
jgi:hypothetical protein